MTLEEKELRYEWLRSQQLWHEKKRGKWHRSQARWFKRVADHVFTLSDIVSRTLRKHQAALVENITRNNALYKLVKKWNG